MAADMRRDKQKADGQILLHSMKLLQQRGGEKSQKRHLRISSAHDEIERFLDSKFYHILLLEKVDLRVNVD